MNRCILSTLALSLFFCVAINAHKTRKSFSPTIENLNAYTFMPSIPHTFMSSGLDRPETEITSQDYALSVCQPLLNTPGWQDNAIRIKDLIQSVQQGTPLAHATVRISYTCKEHIDQGPDRSYGGKLPIFCNCLKLRYPMAIFDAHQGITVHDQSAITIFSRGYARKANPKKGMPQKGGGIFDGYVRKRDNIMHLMPSVVFDYPDERRNFNFCQDLDIECLKTVYDQTVAQNPDARIILSGDCRGALNVLKFVAANADAKNVDALVLVSPFISVSELTTQISRSYFYTPLIGRLLHRIFKWHFYNYNPEKDTLMQDIRAITGKKIFIAHRAHDSLVSDVSMYHLAQKLSEYGNDVYLIIIHDTGARHSRLSPLLPFQESVNAFLKKFDYPHDDELAKNGQEFLVKAKEFLSKA